MKKLTVKVSSLKKISSDGFVLCFQSAYLAKKALAGQFMHLKIDSSQTLLRRPFSFYRVEADKIFVLFKLKGEGTKALCSYKKGDPLDIIGPLGNGFSYQNLAQGKKEQILVAGGIGVAPLVFLAEKLRECKMQSEKCKTLVFLGVKTKKEILGRVDFRRMGFKVLIATEDGSLGFKGKVTDLLSNYLSVVRYPLSADLYACGPKAMFAGLSVVLKKHPKIKGQISFEQFMGCGTGVCQSCVIKTKKGYRRVCKDGPVFNIKDMF